MLSAMKIHRFLVLLVFFAFTVLPLAARVTRVEIASRTDVLGGKAFGDAGASRWCST